MRSVDLILIVATIALNGHDALTCEEGSGILGQRNAGLAGLTFAATLALAASFMSSSAHAQATGSDSYKLLRLDGHTVRWPHRIEGQDFVLTYRVLTEFQSFDGARNCGRMTGLSGIEKRSNLVSAQFRAELQAAFGMWERAADIRFREVPDGEAANILIGAQADPEGWAFADVFYNSAAPEEIKPITRSLVCLNPERHWKIGFDGNLGVYDLRYTLAHEIGHAIGLDHPNGAGQMMGYRYEERFRLLQDGDVAGAVAIYGPARGSAGIATSSVAPVQRNPGGDDATSRALRPKPKSSAN